MQGRRRYYGSARLPRSQEWKDAGGKYYPPGTPKRQTPMRASNPILLRLDRTVTGSEQMVEAREVATTSSGGEHYPNGVAQTIPVECSLTLPAGFSDRACQALVHARTAPPILEAPRRPARLRAMVNSRSRGCLARRRWSSARARSTPGAGLCLSIERLSPFAAGCTAGLCCTLHPRADRQQISVGWRSKGDDAGAIRSAIPVHAVLARASGKTLPAAREEHAATVSKRQSALTRSVQ
jgi:hypothetical protein